MLPKKIKVDNTWYSIDTKEHLDKKLYTGEVNYHHRTITLASKSSNGKNLRKSDIQETFWHELTHAILESMGETKLNNNESFVEDFSLKLSRAIASAKF